MFQNFGYMGLCGGLRRHKSTSAKKLKQSQKILDHKGSEELAANLFRATQTEGKLRCEGIPGKDTANQTHFSVGRTIRNTIEELGGVSRKICRPGEKRQTDRSRKAQAATFWWAVF